MTTLMGQRMSPPRRPAGARPRVALLLINQLVYAIRDLWRTRIAFIFTFLFPLTFLLVIGSIAGNETIGPDSTVRIMQFVTPSAALMGALFGAFPTVAASLADARESGLLQRVRGTPLPAWVYLAGRVGAAVTFAFCALVLMLLVGVVAFDVRIQWHTMPATVGTALLSLTCFAAVGVATAGLVSSAAFAQAVAIGAAVILSFLSGVMGYGDMPAWADRIAQLFPLKPFHDALGQQFDPFATGAGWDVGALAVIGAWSVGAALVAAQAFRFDPVEARRTRRTAGASRAGGAVGLAGRPRPAMHVTEAARPSRLAMLVVQTSWATRAALHDVGWVLFAIAMPVGLYAFNAAVLSEPAVGWSPPLTLQVATGMIAWAVIVTGLVNMPEAIARARDRGVLKRLRGTPVEVGTYFAGRFVSALVLVATTAALVLLTGLAWFDLRIAWSGVPLAVALLVLGTGALAACGILLVSLLASSKAVTAVGLGVALPVSFFSDVFAIQAGATWMTTVGSVMPLKHLANSLAYALDPAGPTVSWLGVAVLSAWLLGASALAVRTFRWSARS